MMLLIRSRTNYIGDSTGLVTSISVSGTTITWNTGAPGFPSMAAPYYAEITAMIGPGPTQFEIMYLTAFTSGATTGTVLRAQEGTSNAGAITSSPWDHSMTTLDVFTSAPVTFTAVPTTVASGSNTGTIANIASWSTASAGVLDTVVSGSTFTGCTYLSGSPSGTVSTGGVVTPAWIPSVSGSQLFAAFVVGGSGGGGTPNGTTSGGGGGGAEVLPNFYLGNVMTPQAITIGTGGAANTAGNPTSIGSLVTANNGATGAAGGPGGSGFAEIWQVG